MQRVLEIEGAASVPLVIPYQCWRQHCKPSKVSTCEKGVGQGGGRRRNPRV